MSSAVWPTCWASAGSRDQDGDYFFRSGSAACYARVEDQDPVIVRVFAIGVSHSAKLLHVAEINEVNSHSGSAWVTWAAG